MQRGLLVEFSCNSPTLYLIALLRALLVVRSFVLEWRVVATTYVSNVKLPIDNFLDIIVVLVIPDIDPDYCHIWLRQYFDDAWPWSKNNLIKDVGVLEDMFNILSSDASVWFVNVVWDANNLEIQLRLWQS